MSSLSFLEQMLREILLLINPSGDDWSVRFHIIEDVRAAVQSVESLRGATVEPFGSFVSNLFTKWGDLDISIEILTGAYITSAGKKQKQSFLVEVLRALRKRGTWRKLHFIANARVPILNLEHKLQNISCDISINNLHGQMKSKMLFWLNDIDGRFRDMVLLIKEWAKAHEINDSKSGSMNSYCLSLLIIFHFQTCIPAILPPLKEIYPGNITDDLTGVRTVAEKLIEETCAENINKFRSDRSRGINHSSLSELFVSFFAKFCDISMKASDQGISPYTGQWEDIESNMIWLPKTYALFVEDPFEQPVNTARSVSSKHLTRIANAFQTTHQALISANNENRNTIQAKLIRERLLSVANGQARYPSNHGNYPGTQSIHGNYSRPPLNNGNYPGPHNNRSYHPRTPNDDRDYRSTPNNNGNYPRTSNNNGYYPKNPNNNGNYPRTRVQVIRAAPSQSQVQQSQITKADEHPNNVDATKPVQQIWRPRSN